MNPQLLEFDQSPHRKNIQVLALSDRVRMRPVRVSPSHLCVQLQFGGRTLSQKRTVVFIYFLVWIQKFARQNRCWAQVAIQDGDTLLETSWVELCILHQYLGTYLFVFAVLGIIVLISSCCLCKSCFCYYKKICKIRPKKSQALLESTTSSSLDRLSAMDSISGSGTNSVNRYVEKYFFINSKKKFLMCQFLNYYESLTIQVAPCNYLEYIE